MKKSCRSGKRGFLGEALYLTRGYFIGFSTFQLAFPVEYCGRKAIVYKTQSADIPCVSEWFYRFTEDVTVSTPPIHLKSDTRELEECL